MAPTTRKTPASPTSPIYRHGSAARRRRSSPSDNVQVAMNDPKDRTDRPERTKRGCWTCRIRRKKCDEEHVDGRCKTCLRLRIECLGWGAKRPDWMKDKDKVDAKKAEIKKQLATQGMIRGQARPHSPVQQQPSVDIANSTSPSASHSDQFIAEQSRSQRPPRAAKSQAIAQLSNVASSESESALTIDHSPSPASPASPATIMSSTPGGQEDTEYILSDDAVDYHKLFVSAKETFTASPSFPASPLPVVNSSFSERESAFGAVFAMQDSAYDTILDEKALSALGGMVDPASLNEQLGYDALYSSYLVTEPSPSTSASTSMSLPSLPSTLPAPPSTSPMTSPTGMENIPRTGILGQPGDATYTSQTEDAGTFVSSPIGMGRTMSNGSTTSTGQNDIMYGSNTFEPMMTDASHMDSYSAAVQSTSMAPVASGLVYGPAPPPSYTTAMQQYGAQQQQQQQQQQSAYSMQAVTYNPRVRAPISNASALGLQQETLVFYYFNRGVRKMQYLLADDATSSVTDIMYDLIMKDPSGPVTNAICSLSSLHNTRLRIAEGLTHPEDIHAHDKAQKYYEDTVRQLSLKSESYSEVEAVAALHLLSFWLFCGGGGDWASALSIAGEWFTKTEVMKDHIDPLKILNELKPAARFAAQGTMWMDILAGVSLRRTPRFMKLYRRLWNASRISHMSVFSMGLAAIPTGGQKSALMHSVMGCDDEVMFAIAAIAELADWKHRQEVAGRLSYPELIRMGNKIKEDLLASPAYGGGPKSPTLTGGVRSPVNGTRPGKQSRKPTVWDPYNFEQRSASGSFDSDGLHNLNTAILGSPASSRSPVSPSSTSPVSASGLGPLAMNEQPITLIQLASNVFREAAFLDLETVLSGCNPRVPEIADCVAALIRAIQMIPSTDLDRSLAFPITIGGCLSELPEHREFFRERLAAQGTFLGNGSQARLLMETVWRRRDSGQQGVCWRDTMRELGFDLLLV
ncbi:hypothetical protein FRC02_004692 [Tulasnella sp. 418]|nr:hypothetical protein FRC02_004692 [Tulasnella sp. 418]